MNLRKTIYRQHGQPISLLFLDCLGDEHPEHIDAPPPPPAPKLPRPPRLYVSNPRGRPRKSPDFEAVLQRIERGGM